MLCRKLAEKLARKRPSPLLSGSPNTWASGIVRAIGGVNFLHDRSQTPHMRSTDIDHYFGISPSSGAAKLAAIRKMLKMHQLDPNWTLPSRLEDNPMVWMLQVNGFMMDVRQAPREVQEIAFNKGLIPYIPADRQRARSEAMAKKPKPKSPFAGRWRIVSMSAWDQDYMDEEEEGYFEFRRRASGEFHFGYVHGQHGLRADHTRRRASRRMDLGRQRRNGPGAGPRLGRDEGRRTARHDLLPRRRRSEFVAKRAGQPSAKSKKTKR